MKQLTAKQIAEMCGGKVIGNDDAVVTGAASLENAKETDCVFIGVKRYLEALPQSAAGVVMLSSELEGKVVEGRNFVVCDHVDASFSQVVDFFAPEPITFAPGIHPSAVVDPTAKIGENVYIGANSVVEANAEIGDGTSIGACCYIGQYVKIGMGNKISPNVTIMHRCVIGHKNIIHPGVVIGADGFGFVPGPKGLVKVAQTGIVQIDDDIEIGANTTIDRARFEKTWIKSNVKIDNLVMIAHNVEIGESSIVIGQSGIAGSAKVGRGVILAAQSGVNGHITIGDGVKVAGTSGVVKSVAPGQTVLGTPAEGQREFMERYTLPKKVKRLTDKIDKLKKEIQELKNK